MAGSAEGEKGSGESGQHCLDSAGIRAEPIRFKISSACSTACSSILQTTYLFTYLSLACLSSVALKLLDQVFILSQVFFATLATSTNLTFVLCA